MRHGWRGPAAGEAAAFEAMRGRFGDPDLASPSADGHGVRQRLPRSGSGVREAPDHDELREAGIA